MAVVILHFRDMWIPSDTSHLSALKKLLLTLLTPFYTGSEAVILFFVLSGLVLSLPYLKGRPQSYRKYLARRVLRIYGPYVAALALAVACAALLNDHDPRGKWDESYWSAPFNVPLLIQHIAFIGVYDWSQYDFVIWSLIQEMRISIVFPLLIFMTVRLGNTRSVLLGMALSAITFGFVPSTPDKSIQYSLLITLHYIAFFIIGIVIASNLERCANWWRDLSGRERWLLVSVCLAAYTMDNKLSEHVLKLLNRGTVPLVSSRVLLANWVAAFGAAILIILAVSSRHARLVLNCAPARFLGRISYSLYLLHPIVLLTLTYLVGDRISPWWQFPIYLSASLLVAYLFWLVVEDSFTKLSRAVR